MALTPAVRSSDHIQGNPNARITLVEYGDYECPYCGQAYPIVKDLQTEFGLELRFVFRNFPLKESHPLAEVAAWLAEGAGDAFWEIHDLLYENQSRLDVAHLRRYGHVARMDDAAIDHALAGAFADRVRADFRSGLRSGVNGTPTFFVNGVRHDGGFDGETLGAALLAALDA